MEGNSGNEWIVVIKIKDWEGGKWVMRLDINAERLRWYR